MASKVNGIVIHCEVEPRAGQRKATRGNSGLTSLLSLSTVTMLAVVGVLVNGVPGAFFLRGR